VRITVTVILGLLAVRAHADDLAERAARSYAVDVSGSTTELAVGGRGVLLIAIHPQPGVHVQSQAPLRLTLSASPGLALARDRLAWPDAVLPNADSPRFEVAFTASAPGPQAARARLEFFVCSSTWCVKQEREVALPVTVEGGPGAQSGSRSSNPVVTPEARP
jgi:hypothetical protein